MRKVYVYALHGVVEIAEGFLTGDGFCYVERELVKKTEDGARKNDFNAIYQERELACVLSNGADLILRESELRKLGSLIAVLDVMDGDSVDYYERCLNEGLHYFLCSVQMPDDCMLYRYVRAVDASDAKRYALTWAPNNRAVVASPVPITHLTTNIVPLNFQWSDIGAPVNNSVTYAAQM